MKNKLRVGVIGCGAIGREHIRRMTNLVQETVVTAVSDYVLDVAKKVGEQYNAVVFETGQELIASELVDAVLVTSTDDTHAIYVMECLKHKKYVFCEKPLAQTAAECEEMMMAEQVCGKRLVQVGFMRRFDRGYARLKEIVAGGELGRPLMIHAAHRNVSQAPGFETDYAITRVAIHELDVSRWLLDDEYETAQVLDVTQSSASEGEWLNPQIVMLKTKSGQRIDIEVQTDGAYAYDIQCQVVCEHGTVNLPDPDTVIMRAKNQRTYDLLTDWSQRFVEAYDIEFQEWAKAVLAENLTGPSTWDGYAACVAADAAKLSRKTGKPELVKMISKPEIYK